MLKKLFRNKYPALSLINFLLTLVARNTRTFSQMRGLIDQLDAERADRIAFTHVNASQRFANEPINYVDIGSRDGLLGFLKPFEKILNIIFFEPDHEEFNKLQNTHQSQRVQIFNTAVSDTNSKKILNLLKFRPLL